MKRIWVGWLSPICCVAIDLKLLAAARLGRLLDPRRDNTVSNGLPRGEKGWLGSGTWILNETPGVEVSSDNWRVYLGASHAVLAWGNLIAMVESPLARAETPR